MARLSPDTNGPVRGSLRRFDNLGFEVGRGHYLQHCEVIRDLQLTVFDPRWLQHEIAFPDGAYTLSFEFKPSPPFKYLDKLEIAVVDVPLLHVIRVRAAVRSNDVCNIVTPGCTGDTKIPVIKDSPQPF